jgi:hypothetical protein
MTVSPSHDNAKDRLSAAPANGEDSEDAVRPRNGSTLKACPATDRRFARMALDEVDASPQLAISKWSSLSR